MTVDRYSLQEFLRKEKDVVMRDVPENTWGSTELQFKFRGPLAITKEYPSDTYGIAELRCNAKGRRYSTTAFASQMKLWPCPEADLIDDSCDSEKDKRTKRVRKAPCRYDDDNK